MSTLFREVNNNQAGKFIVEICGEEVYLSILEKNDDDGVTINAVNELLKKVGAVEIDSNAVGRAIAGFENSARVAQVPKPTVEITLENNDMKATLCIKGSNKYHQLKKAEVFEEIEQHGIIYGVDYDAVDKALVNIGSRYTLAEGRLPQDGEDTKIEFKKDIHKERGRPKELEGGRVDYKDLDLFLAVTEGEVIAERIPWTEGEDGVTVKGEFVKARPGQDKTIKFDKNIALEGNLFIAKNAGHLQIISGRMQISPVLKFQGDIDLSTGNITFPGDIIIKGSVQAGFFVKAGGRVQIGGSIHGGTVEAEALVVKLGIQGAPNAYVSGTELIKAKFIENAVVSSQGDIVIEDTILHSKVAAGKKIVVTSSKGLIAGGRLLAGEEVNVKNIGTQMAPPTIIEVGVNPELKEELLRCRSRLKEITAKQEGLQKSLLLIKPDEESAVPENRQELYMKLTKINFTFRKEIQELQEQLVYLEDEVLKLKDGKIRCNGAVYPGVKLVINNIVYPIIDIIQFAVFYMEDDEVKFSSYA